MMTAPLSADRRYGAISYVLAAVIGACWVWAVFPDWALLGRLPPGAPGNADLIQHITGQRYFWHDAWHATRPLWANTLDTPYGVMIGLTDSLPLPSLLMRPFVFLLPASFQGITVWLALSWVLQPVAAVFALRGVRETRLLPAIAVAACASAMPTFLARLNHAALSSHFLLLLALGLALRLAHPTLPRPWRGRALLASCLLIPVLLLIHPYLMMMAVIVLLSAPLTLLLRRDRRWRMAALALGLSILLTAGLAGLLGYINGGDEVSGFGLYSMNLLSPVWPSSSAVLGAAAPPGLDATGGQYEGFQYLGAGLLLGLVALLACRRHVFKAVAHHPGLLLACLLLCAVAVSTHVYLGHRLLMALPAPKIAGIFRVSGRFFWPVAYAALIGTVAILARAPYRVAAPVLLSIALLQTLDATKLAARDRTTLSVVLPFSFDAVALQHLMATSRLLDIHPAWPCSATISEALDLMAVFAVADRVIVPVDTSYTARATHPPHCDDARTVAQPLAPGELRILLPDRVDLMPLVPGNAKLCRRFGSLGVCSAELAN